MGVRDPSVAAAGFASSVTPSTGDVTFDPPTRGLYVGSLGSVQARMHLGQNTVTFSAVPAGTLLPICVDQVLSAGTSSTDILRLW
jgi:hypothetical protein